MHLSNLFIRFNLRFGFVIHSIHDRDPVLLHTMFHWDAGGHGIGVVVLLVRRPRSVVFCEIDQSEYPSRTAHVFN